MKQKLKITLISWIQRYQKEYFCSKTGKKNKKKTKQKTNVSELLIFK